MSELHIHGQKFQHDDVLIEGTPEELIKLRDLLIRATESNALEVIDDSFYTNDGEGYSIRVKPCSSLADRPLPYPIMRMNWE